MNTMIAIRQPTFNEVMSVRRLGRELRVSQSWLIAEANAGRIPSISCGAKNYLFNRETVEKCLADRAAKGEQ